MSGRVTDSRSPHPGRRSGLSGSAGHDDILPAGTVGGAADVEDGEAAGGDGLLHLARVRKPESGLLAHLLAVRVEDVGLAEGDVRQRHRHRRDLPAPRRPTTPVPGTSRTTGSV